MKTSKIIWMLVYSLMTIWWFYQINVLPDGYQRYFIMFMAFVCICLVLIKAYDIKPVLNKKSKPE